MRNCVDARFEGGVYRRRARGGTYVSATPARSLSRGPLQGRRMPEAPYKGLNKGLHTDEHTRNVNSKI